MPDLAMVRADAWDDAMLLLLVEHPGEPAEVLLALVIEEATSAMARLVEQGKIERSDEDEG